MADHFVSRGFVPKRRDLSGTNRVPPGQYLVRDFPVLSAGPTPRTPLDRWTFTIEGLVTERMQWTWAEFMTLPMREFTVDIHCVTKWSKLNTVWRGISLDDLFEQVQLAPKASFLTAYCDGDYTTNLPLPEVLNGQAFIAFEFDGRPLAPEHGGPARLVVPHLYFWKSAKWIRGLHLMEHDKRGFWESLGYHNHGDPWKEQRYSADE